RARSRYLLDPHSFPYTTLFRSDPLALVAVFHRQGELGDTFFDVAETVEFIGAPVQPHTTGGDVPTPSDESAFIFRPVLQIIDPVAVKICGDRAELIAEGIGQEIQSRQVRAI